MALRTALSLLAVAFLLPVASVFAKRRAPAKVEALVANGVRYVVPHFGWEHQKTQNGGYVQAWNVETGSLVWDRMVYRVVKDPRLEGDVQDVFITELTLADGQLQIANERGERYVMDLASGQVRASVKLPGNTALPDPEAQS
jgi:outer membrane protein assembly factor BamB